VTGAWTDDSLGAVRRFLKERGLIAGKETPRRIGDGHSNLTYLIGDVVLRRPPPPPLPPGANDVLREARILTALEPSGLPAPRVLAVAKAGEVLDVPFYVMTHVAGHVITERLPARFDDPASRRDIAFELVDRLADLHAVDWRAAGLGDFGRPEGFNARHLRRIESLMRLGQTGPLPPAFEAALDWLGAHVPPESGAAIFHGDFRIGNVIFADETPPRLAAILDWELATIGDPLLDLGYLVSCHPGPGEVPTPTQDLSLALSGEGAPTRAALIERYAARSGRDVSGLDWHAAFAAWKTGVLYEYSRRQGRDAYYADPDKPLRFMAAANRFAGLD
jgi:aminoglycoside phosphotransferase (APT) family kinase protein